MKRLLPWRGAFSTWKTMDKEYPIENESTTMARSSQMQTTSRRRRIQVLQPSQMSGACDPSCTGTSSNQRWKEQQQEVPSVDTARNSTSYRVRHHRKAMLLTRMCTILLMGLSIPFFSQLEFRHDQPPQTPLVPLMHHQQGTEAPAPNKQSPGLQFSRVVQLSPSTNEHASTTDTTTHHATTTTSPNPISNFFWKPKQNSRLVPPLGDITAQEKIRKRDRLGVDTVETKDCKLREWQRTFRPSCNAIHEVDATQQKIVGNGYWRDVWIVQDSFNKTAVFKTIRFEHEITLRNFDRMRRDAVAMDQLTKSPFIIDIYSYCGTSSLSEYGDGGDIFQLLWPKNRPRQPLSKLERLRIATQTAVALSAVHNVDKMGVPSIAHTDIAPGQFVKVKGRYKLNDFNRARFLAWSTKDNSVCPYYVGNNPGKLRSPEEYKYDPQTEKVDVYSLGNIFFMLFQNEYPFQDVASSDAKDLVMKGERPSIYADLWQSQTHINVALKHAMIMCHEQDPANRSSSREVELYLTEQLRKLDPDFNHTMYLS